MKKKNDALKTLTWRSLIIGIAMSAVINLWLHHAELVLGGQRGHTALANTSIPVGAFSVLFAIVALNLLLTRFIPTIALTRGELVVIYVMCTVSTVLSSSGGLHFLIPTLTAAHYFATETNQWANLFHHFIPSWLAQTNQSALDAFYMGNSPLPWGDWGRQIAIWMTFIFLFTSATLCISILIRKQWIENEKLTFPTTVMPLEITQDGVPLFKNRLFWGSTVVIFLLGTLNTANLNIPAIPGINVRATDLSQYVTSPPWNAIGFTPITFFPFAIGIGYLLSTEVAFSCWFFFLITKSQHVFGAASGITQGASPGAQSIFPYIGFQAAGAFLGLALSVLWISRKYFRQILRQAFPGDQELDDEGKTYRWAFIGLLISFVGLVAFARIAGATLFVAFSFITLVLLYLLAATRIRAETGNAWPVGPEVDGYRLMMTTLGTRFYTPADLTALTYVRAATAGQDFRGVCMPHQLDAFKMADAAKLNYRSLVWAMLIAVAIGVTISFIIALSVWTHYGALAKTDAWRSYAGRNSFNILEQALKTPRPPDWNGLGAVGVGAMVTWVLAALRMQYAWWPFHPVGYAMANTWTMSYAWMPFFIAWVLKICIIRFGGLRLYRRALPLFLGLIAGDFLHGALWTLVAIFTDINVYPMNW